MTDSLTEDLYNSFFEALLAGDRKTCSRIMSGLLESGVAIRDIYELLLQRALYQVGALWEEHRISVADEHMATALVESLLTLAHPIIFAGPHIGKRAVVACVTNEYHQLGGKMVADIMEMIGWDTYFLGANVPREALYRMLDERKPHLLCLSVAISDNLADLGHLLEEVTARKPGLPVLVGGQALLREKVDLSRFGPNVRAAGSLRELEKLLQTL